MRLFLIRHGESTGDIEGRFGGKYDDELSVNGRNQSKILALLLKDKGIYKIISSNLIRAKQSMNIIAGIINAETETQNDLKERDYYGILSGLTKAEAKKKYPIELAKLDLNGQDLGIIEQEKYTDFRSRIIKTFNSIIQKEIEFQRKRQGLTNKNIALITHSGVIRVIFREFLNNIEFKKIGDCACLELYYSDKVFNVISIHNAIIERNPNINLIY